jgi:hypothetical protein
LLRYVPSGTYYARFRVRSKLIWKSLKTDKISIAQMRLGDMIKEEKKKADTGRVQAKGHVLVEATINAYRENGFRPG